MRPAPKRALLTRVVAYTVVGALAIAALVVRFPRPRAVAPFAAAASVASAAAEPSDSAWRVQTDTLRAGETISSVLSRGGVSDASAARVLAAASALDERRVPAGMPVFVRSRGADSTPSEITFQLSIDRLLHVRRTSDSTWESTEERLPWKNDTLVVGGRIDANLYQALDDSAASLLPKRARAELAWAIADIYEYRVDMSRDLRPGDSFRVLFERAVGPGGVVEIGDVLAVRFDLSGSPVEAIRFATGARRAEYFDQTGRSLRAAFLRAPLAFRRISSVFGLRKHPILGVWRQHKGTDYAAKAGTPVRAIGDGTVIFAGRKSGYGNVLELRHRNGFVSRYGHLRAFAAGIRRGKSVSIGQTVAYVGMTGLATAPHLHFEILVNGVQRNPSTALNRKDGLPIAASERARFMSLRSTLLAALDQRGGEQLAGR